MLSVVIVVASVVFYCRVGEAEYSSGAPLATASFALWLIAGGLLHWGLFGGLLLQVGLFTALIAWNIARDLRA